MPRKTSFADLVGKVQQRTITAAEFRDWFVEDTARTRAFDFNFILNVENVDVTGLERAAELSASALASEANRTIDNRQSLARAQTVSPNGTIVAEGDSWFRLPWFYPPYTVIDLLQRRYPIDNLARWGEELSAMVAAGEYIPHLATGKVRFLLFSGGGNDLLGSRFTSFLRHWDSDHDGPQHAAYYLRPEFDRALDELELLYRLVARNASSLSPSTRLVVHGYDHVIPRNGGVFLGKQMEDDLNLHPYYNAKLCAAILALMINRFNARLAKLQNELPNFRHLDLRGKVGANGWFDEIHPNTAAAGRVARCFEKALGAPAVMASARSRSRQGVTVARRARTAKVAASAA